MCLSSHYTTDNILPTSKCIASTSHSHSQTQPTHKSHVREKKNRSITANRQIAGLVSLTIGKSHVYRNELYQREVQYFSHHRNCGFSFIRCIQSCTEATTTPVIQHILWIFMVVQMYVDATAPKTISNIYIYMLLCLLTQNTMCSELPMQSTRQKSIANGIDKKLPLPRDDLFIGASPNSA